MKMSKRLLTGVIVFSVIVIVLIVKLLVSVRPQVESAESFRIKGNRDAKIRVVEYTDFQCPACAKAAELVAEVFEKNPNKIFLEIRHFPLRRHKFARRAAAYTECAGAQGQFWPLHNDLFKTQGNWQKMSEVDGYFSQLAVSQGVNGEKLAACLKGSDIDSTIDKDVESGKSKGVNSTPTFFVNEKMVVGGPAFVREVEALIGEGK
jgi:protein-disulfide isomerase